LRDSNNVVGSPELREDREAERVYGGLTVLKRTLQLEPIRRH